MFGSILCDQGWEIVVVVFTLAAFDFNVSIVDDGGHQHAAN